MNKVTKSIEKELQKFLDEKYKEGMSEEERFKKNIMPIII